jgi:lactoylglutathione lyase
MPKIVHIALKVKDIDRASAFYQKVFGFEPVRTEDVRDHTSCHLSDGVIDLSLMQYAGDSPESLLSGRGPCIHHFGIEVEDLGAAAAELQAAGCEILSPPGEIPVKFRDPNGVVAELVPPGRYK